MNKPNELKVFISHRESICGECQENLGSKAWIFLDQKKGALCLACADLDHLEFLPSGDMALTLRSKKYSPIYAVVLRWSRARKRYERQGLLVSEEAINKAEEECLKDHELRERRRIRDTERREELDQDYIDNFAKRIREMFTKMPSGREIIIAEHACKKYSGRVGRSSAGKSFDEIAINLAVKAHIRHTLTDYDELLLNGYDRYDARRIVEKKIIDIIESWQ